ncbi:classical SDR family protein [Candidatus Planktophila vernalis]|uniref:Classical SDR family protein n=1 Tax=Candidatus Planktophila vernalis TaxID=1884907 RepID=A0A249KTN8_9ACTN|nr:SDR family NAD(P)-dependent oxidoreductase [Candidatus Planktophila vernalis]ASY20170.1 classical SDR family protein [Candidatus Planktophila vernalis]
MTNFKGKRILITGASRGVGFEASKLFLKAGAHVIGTGRDETRLKATTTILQQLGDFTPLLADFDDAQAPAAVAQAVKAQWDSLDMLLNNAAVQTYKSDWMEEGLQLLNDQWRCNVFAQHELIFRLQDLLKAGSEPRIVNVSSGAGSLQALKESPDMPTYRLTKYALGGMTILWAGLLKGQVAVNALDPGWLKTDLGGPGAPGEPSDGGERMWEICSLDWSETGKFWHGNQEIDF